MRSALVAVGIALLSAGTSLGASVPPPSAELVGGPVTMNVLTGFSPPVVVVSASATVTWQNTDGVAHTVTSYLGGPPDSGFLPPGNTYSATFTQVGATAYRCMIHPWMNGVVLVTP